MTSFTQEQGGDLGLNIVYEEIANTVPLKGKKPKKRNKYERRREKSKRATDKKEKAVTSAEERGPTNSISEEIIEKSLTVESIEISTEQHPIASEEARMVPDDSPVEVQPKTLAEEPAAISNSRKIHKTTTTTLEDNEERAKYMAEFHARPLEIDRRSGASSRIAPSKASTHLFQDESGCAQLGLHTRLTTCLTSRFHLERPTVIQQKSLLALENKADANLFVQSETGSGKTLAFLLPIVQVSTLFYNYLRKVGSQ